MATLISGVSLISAVICGTPPHPLTSFWTAAQYRHMSRSMHCVSNSGCPNSIRRRNPGKYFTCCVTKGQWEHLLAVELRSRVPLARLSLTPWHYQARLLWCRERADWRVEWCSVVFSDENRFCLYVSDGRTHVWHRPGEHHLQSAFAHDTQAPPQASWCEGHQLQLAVTFVVSAG